MGVFGSMITLTANTCAAVQGAIDGIFCPFLDNWRSKRKSQDESENCDDTMDEVRVHSRRFLGGAWMIMKVLAQKSTVLRD